MQKQWGKIFLLACMLNGKPYARVFWHGKGRLPWFLIWATGWRKSYKVKVLSNYPQDVTLHNLLSHYAIEYYKNNVLYYHYINYSFLPFWSNNRLLFWELVSILHEHVVTFGLWKMVVTLIFWQWKAKRENNKFMFSILNTWRYIDVRNLDVIKALQTWFSVLSSATLKSIYTKEH